MTSSNVSKLAAQAERDAMRVLAGDLVTTLAVIPGHAGCGIVTEIHADGTVQVTDGARRTVTVPRAGVVIESGVMDVADELTETDMRRLARWLPGVRRADAEFEDWAAAVAIARIVAVTE